MTTLPKHCCPALSSVARNSGRLCRLFVFGLWALASVGFGVTFAAAKPGDAHPELGPLVDKYLHMNRLYAAGDLLCQSEVEMIFNAMLDQGWQPLDGEDLYDSILPDKDPLIILFQTTPGRQFIRQVAKLPGAYDRLERLTWTRAGNELLKALVASPSGVQEFQQLMTPEGTARFQKVIEREPRGQNFALPTGHIHTADELLDRIGTLWKPPVYKPRPGARTAVPGRR